jgi:hypothetical protein
MESSRPGTETAGEAADSESDEANFVDEGPGVIVADDGTSAQGELPSMPSSIIDDKIRSPTVDEDDEEGNVSELGSVAVEGWFLGVGCDSSSPSSNEGASRERPLTEDVKSSEVVVGRCGALPSGKGEGGSGGRELPDKVIGDAGIDLTPICEEDRECVLELEG